MKCSDGLFDRFSGQYTLLSIPSLHSWQPFCRLLRSASSAPGMRGRKSTLVSGGLVCLASTFFFPLLGLQILQFSGTQAWRLALLPLICFSAIRYATRYTTGAPLLDMIFIGVLGAYGVMKGLEWSLCSSEEYQWKGKEPLSRLGFAHELMSNMRYALVPPVYILLIVPF